MSLGSAARGRGAGWGEDRRREVRELLKGSKMHQRQSFCFSRLPNPLMVRGVI